MPLLITIAITMQIFIRGVHSLSQEATDKYEEARIKIQQHFNAKKAYEIIFTAGTTHRINMVALGFSEF